MRKRCLLGWMLMSGVVVMAFADLEGAEEAPYAGADEVGEVWSRGRNGRAIT